MYRSAEESNAWFKVFQQNAKKLLGPVVCNADQSGLNIIRKGTTCLAHATQLLIYNVSYDVS